MLNIVTDTYSHQCSLYSAPCGSWPGGSVRGKRPLHCHMVCPEALQQTNSIFSFWAWRCSFCPLFSSGISVTILEFSLTSSPCCESDCITLNGMMSDLGDYGDNVGGGHSLAKVYINFNYYLQLSPAHTPVLSQTPLLSFAINCMDTTYNLPPSSSFLVFIFILLSTTAIFTIQMPPSEAYDKHRGWGHRLYQQDWFLLFLLMQKSELKTQARSTYLSHF